MVEQSTEIGMWDGFKEDIDNRRPVRLCGMGQYLDTLEAAPRKMVQDAGADNEVPITVLHRALLSRGFSKSSEVVRRHFAGGCSCYRGMS